MTSRLTPRSALVLGVASVAGLVMFLWPLFVQPAAGATRVDQPFIFMALLPIVVLVVVAELTEGGMDAKDLAMLGVLTAVNAALRPLGAGTAGIETVFFVLVLAGRVFGPGFGYVLGCTSLFASALLTSGVGPWLPFQMMCAAWIGLGAGLLPRRVTGRAEVVMLVVYAVVVAYAFGMLMNLSSWPFQLGIAVPGSDRTLQLVPGDPVGENLHRFLLYNLLTSTWGWDTGRAITNALLVGILGPPVLTTLRRAARRARYGQPAVEVAQG
ncbi:energy-coupling factor transport system substrate-specific component [Aeromicrobium sp. SORGH_AS981]|uniref:ECF transporter S component n=1 Tax=Aeromicrobium sp. SORGH_AS_0981 TaxID=3041802 RepID=UPI002862E94A|nr:ECF transporter S component [Aeromicrobium sp. SORGH_AS_0981]MDR6118141.1 energy-coupling factor transport system substrate-specific component [Aeromicrobium sp. SORGH_AS_0981]